MDDLHPPPPGPDEPPPPYVESEPPSHAPPSSYSQNVTENPQGHQQQQSPPTPSSASQYFASRPSQSSHVVTYPLHIRPNSPRSDYPYPREWAPARDVSIQDWATFIRFLIPDDAVTRDAKGLSPERHRSVEATIQEWNDGFFLPRGVKVHLDYSRNPSQPQEPTNSYSPSFSTHASSSSASSSMPSSPPPRSSKERWRRKLKDKASEKDIFLTTDTIRMGNKLSLGPGGIKIGRFALDERGMNYGGRQIGPQMPPAVVHPYHRAAPPNAAQQPYGHLYGHPYGHPRPASSFGSPPLPVRVPQGGTYAPPPMSRGQPHGAYGQPQQYAPPLRPPPGQYGQQQTGTTW